MALPKWARKPKHKENVICTKHGWVVERTGEILVRIRNLDKKIADFLNEETPTKNEPTKEAVVEKTTPEPKKDDESIEKKSPTTPKKKSTTRKKKPVAKKNAVAKRKMASKKSTPKKADDAANQG